MGAGLGGAERNALGAWPGLTLGWGCHSRVHPRDGMDVQGDLLSSITKQLVSLICYLFISLHPVDLVRNSELSCVLSLLPLSSESGLHVLILDYRIILDI